MFVERIVHFHFHLIARPGSIPARTIAQRHVELVDRIRTLGAAALRVSRRLAAGETPYGGTEAKSVKRALDALALAGVASHRGRGDWYISDPLLARYIRETLRI